MSSRFVKILSIAILSAFLTGCGGDSSQDSESYEEKSVDYHSRAMADVDYAKEQFDKGNYIDAAKGVFKAVGNFVASKVQDILAYMSGSQGSYKIDERRLVGHGSLADVAKLFANKSKTMAIDYYNGGELVPLGQLVLRYSSMVEKDKNALKQRLVSTIQLHEATNYHGEAQLSLLCNNDKRSSVDFGIGQVNTVSWGSICKNMVDENIVLKATDICKDYRSNPNYYKQKYGKDVNGKLVFNINSYILEQLENNFGGKEGLVRYSRSPFNPITNTECTYRHLNEDFKTAYNLFRSCKELETVSGYRFKCSGNPEFDYAAVALIAYGGITKGMVAEGVRLKDRSTGKIQQTFDDYIAEFRAAYSALFKDAPPF